MPTTWPSTTGSSMRPRRIGHHKTKKEAVTTALREYIDHRKQLEILALARYHRLRSDVRLQEDSPTRSHRRLSGEGSGRYLRLVAPAAPQEQD